jgi:hypothetical protein
LKNDARVLKNFSIAQKAHNIIVPPVVYYEVKRGLIPVNSKNKLLAFDKLINNHSV